jgi:hypothetical protein
MCGATFLTSVTNLGSSFTVNDPLLNPRVFSACKVPIIERFLRSTRTIKVRSAFYRGTGTSIPTN